MQGYVLNCIAIRCLGFEAFASFLDPDPADDTAGVGLDHVKEFSPDQVRLTALVAGVAAGHLQDLTTFDLGKNMIEGMPTREAAREETTLEGQEVTGERRDMAGFDDQPSDDH